jgi:hypothetical protein
MDAQHFDLRPEAIDLPATMHYCRAVRSLITAIDLGSCGYCDFSAPASYSWRAVCTYYVRQRTEHAVTSEYVDYYLIEWNWHIKLVHALLWCSEMNFS